MDATPFDITPRSGGMRNEQRDRTSLSGTL
jgi:hypothetical protein